MKERETKTFPAPPTPLPIHSATVNTASPLCWPYSSPGLLINVIHEFRSGLRLLFWSTAYLSVWNFRGYWNFSPLQGVRTLCRLRKGILPKHNIPGDCTHRWRGHSRQAIKHQSFLQRAPSNHSHGLWLTGSFQEPRFSFFLPFLVGGFPQEWTAVNSGFCLKQGHRQYSNCFRALLWPRFGPKDPEVKGYIFHYIWANQTPDSSVFSAEKEAG